MAGVVTAVAAAIPGFIDWTLGIPARTAAKVDGAQVHHVGVQMSAPVPTSSPRQDVTRIAS